MPKEENCELKHTPSPAYPKFTRPHTMEQPQKDLKGRAYKIIADGYMIGAAFYEPFEDDNVFVETETHARGNAYLWANAHKLYDKAKALLDACGLADAAGDLSPYIDGELMDDVAAALAACRVPDDAEAQAEAADSEN